MSCDPPLPKGTATLQYMRSRGTTRDGKRYDVALIEFEDHDGEVELFRSDDIAKTKQLFERLEKHFQPKIAGK